jgi:hypothetical protein
MLTGKEIVVVILTKYEAKKLKEEIEELQDDGRVCVGAQDNLLDLKQRLRDEFEEDDYETD